MRKINAFKKCPVNYSAPWNVIGSEDQLLNDRVTKVSRVRQYDPAKEHAKYVASDFYMENIVAAGAYDMLKNVQLSDNGLDSVDLLDGTVASVFADIDSNPKNNENE